jgi:hypothetical protein
MSSISCKSSTLERFGSYNTHSYLLTLIFRTPVIHYNYHSTMRMAFFGSSPSLMSGRQPLMAREQLQSYRHQPCGCKPAGSNIITLRWINTSCRRSYSMISTIIKLLLDVLHLHTVTVVD